MASYINKAACRKRILDVCETRHHTFTRVGADVFEHLNLMIENEMQKIVSSHPSIGKTIMMGIKKRKIDASDETIKF